MRYAIITDSNVAALYGSSDCFVVPAGESSKSLETIETLASKLSQQGYGRDTTLIGLGGGMITDLTGFLATIFCRGVPFILIPTTLLAMVDASIGGKTAINLAEGKNRLGSLSFPQKVIVHPPFLSTLPDIEWENGFVEILKVGLLKDPDLFYQASQLPIKELIHRAIEVKRRIVAQDPCETGPRALLNLGHTVGHALEALSHYTLPHGKAVATGIVLETRLSHALGALSSQDLHTIEARFPPPLVPYEPHQILQQLFADKKTKNGVPHFVLLKTIGEAHIHPVDMEMLREICLRAR